MVCQLATHPAPDTKDCAIFQCPTCDVSIEDLPSTWTLKKVAYDTLTLPCGHHFNPSAIALHFLLADMRCPVCRQGSDERMHLSELPKALQQVFKRKIVGMVARSEEEDNLTNLLESISVNLEQLERDFCLVVDISLYSQSRVLLQSPIRAVLHESPATYVPFRTQQSFQRMLNQHLLRFKDQTHAKITFAIQHPVMYLPVQTRSMTIQELLRPTDHQTAVPIRVQNGEHEEVVGALIRSPQPGSVKQIQLFMDREIMSGLCVMCIHSHLQELGRQRGE